MPILAPLLGAVAIGPAFVGIAASQPLARAGLGAAGFLWLALGEVLTGKDSCSAYPTGPTRVEGGVDQLGCIRRARAAAVGAVAGARGRLGRLRRCCPLVVRGRWLAVDLVGAGLWAAGLTAAHAALGDMLAATTALGEPRGALSGAIGAALLVVAVSQMTPPAELAPRPAGVRDPGIGLP